MILMKAAKNYYSNSNPSGIQKHFLNKKCTKLIHLRIERQYVEMYGRYERKKTNANLHYYRGSYYLSLSFCIHNDHTLPTKC